VVSLVLTTEISAFLKENWQLPLACAAALGYYSFGLFERMLDRWRREDLRNIVSFAPQLPTIFPIGDGNFRVLANFLVINNADYKIMMQIDTEDFRIGTIPAQVTELDVCQVIQAKAFLGQRSGIIEPVAPNSATMIRYQISARLGKNEHDLNVRWIYEAEGWLPAPIGTRPEYSGSFKLIKNHFEEIVGRSSFNVAR